MPRLDFLASARTLASAALVAVLGATLPGLAAAQGWDWDEDIAPTTDDTTVQVESTALDVWTEPLPGVTACAQLEPCGENGSWS